MYDTYPDELYYLSKKIDNRKFAELKTQLMIVQNPHSKNPKELWNNIRLAERSNNNDQENELPKLDKVGFDVFKAKISQNPRFIVKGN